jgi:adenylate kinase
MTRMQPCNVPCRINHLQVQRGTALAKKAKLFLDSSHHVPDEVMNEVISARLEQVDAEQDGYVLDGYPHTEAQVDFLCSRGLIPDKASSHDFVHVC